MEEKLGGNINFRVDEYENPITHRAAKFFTETDARLSENGGGMTGYVAVTQDNIAAVLRALAELETQVNELKRR